MNANDVRTELLELSRAGDALRGGDVVEIAKWHADVVGYVGRTLGDDRAADVANRLRFTRGATQAEKESNAVGFVTDWIGTVCVGLTDAQIVQRETPEPVVAAAEPEAVEGSYADVTGVDVFEEGAAIVTVEETDGDTGPEAE